MQVRVAEIQDAKAITSVINAAFRLAESFLIDRDRIDAETVQSLLGKGTFLVAFGQGDEEGNDRGALAGCVYVELRGERAYLGLLSVDPKCQKAGLGSLLMNAAEKHCAEAGCRFMDLRIVNVRRELPSFYRHRGYVETGTAPFTPGLNPKVPCHFVEMSKPLT
ncbi:MAG TPA: GNAT family N-acetyltransferase [Terriglobales bacterium]|nr:GNAT family N-acetyltransferase [Terriglobales bacterium]